MRRMPDHTMMKPAEAYAEIGRIAFDQTSLDDALAQIAALAKQTIPGVSEVSVTLLGPGGAHTGAFTGKLALILDEWQYEHGHGPCLAASAANITVSVEDTAGDARWPDWADQAVESGVHSSLSIGIGLQGSLTGALNLYSADPHAFD